MVYLNDVEYRGQEKKSTVMLDLYSRKDRKSDTGLCFLS